MMTATRLSLAHPKVCGSALWSLLYTVPVHMLGGSNVVLRRENSMLAHLVAGLAHTDHQIHSAAVSITRKPHISDRWADDNDNDPRPAMMGNDRQLLRVLRKRGGTFWYHVQPCFQLQHQVHSQVVIHTRESWQNR